MKKLLALALCLSVGGLAVNTDLHGASLIPDPIQTRVVYRKYRKRERELNKKYQKKIGENIDGWSKHRLDVQRDWERLLKIANQAKSIYHNKLKGNQDDAVINDFRQKMYDSFSDLMGVPFGAVVAKIRVLQQKLGMRVVPESQFTDEDVLGRN